MIINQVGNDIYLQFRGSIWLVFPRFEHFKLASLNSKINADFEKNA
jgi:hypothetical protein